jgi:hypothetical protein
MLICMNDVIVLNNHSRHGYLAAKLKHVYVRMTWFYGTCERLESLCPVWDVANASISDYAQSAQSLVNVRIDLTPESTVARIRTIQIL